MRKFVLAIVAFIFLGTTTSGAWPVHGRSSSFNSGKSQVNFNFLQTGYDFPFLNALKTAQAWSWADNTNSPVTPDFLNDDGYLTTLAHGGVKTVFFVPTQVDRPGNYVITWTGNGTARTGMTEAVLPTATFTGSVTGNVLTAGAPTGGTIQKGMTLSVGGIIGDQLTGSPGVAGTYTVVGGSNAGSQSMTTSGGSKVGSGGSGRYVFHSDLNRFDIGISALPVTDMKVFHVDDEAAINRGEIFGTKFKEKLREANFGVLRFLNWGAYSGGFNTSNVTTWASRKPTTHVFYGGYQLKNSLYATTSTSLTAQAYSATGPVGFALADKATVHVVFGQAYPATQVTFTNGSPNVGWTAHGLSVNSRVVLSLDVSFSPGTVPANFARGVTYYVVGVPDADTVTLSGTQGGTAIVAGSAASGITMGNALLTMNISGTGDIDMKAEGAQLLTDFVNSRPITGTSGAMATLTYDAALNAWIKYGADGGYLSQGIDNGVPPELMVRLAYEVGAHPWFTLPFYALDPATDYLPELMTYTKNYPGASWMIPRWEADNEVWNGAGGFFQTPYANAKATANWGSGNHMDEYGKWTSTVGQIAASIYGAGNLGITYQVICGVQSGGSTSGSNQRMEADLYVAQAAAAQSLVWSGGTINLTKTAANGWTSHVAPSNYVSPAERDTATETTRATDFGGVRFVAAITAGAMTVSSIQTSGGALAVGMTLFGRGIANGALQSGVTITGGSAPNWTLSDSGLTLASDTFYAAVDMTQPALYVDSFSGGGTYGLATVNSQYVAWKNWAAGYGVNKMTGYEGGYSPDYSGSTTRLNILRYAAKLVASSPGNATGMQGYTKINYDNFILAGGEFPSMFQFSGIYPSSTVWSVMEDLYQPNPPQFEAAKAFNANWLLKRDLDPAANDNDPMWLEKAA